MYSALYVQWAVHQMQFQNQQRVQNSKGFFTDLQKPLGPSEQLQDRVPKDVERRILGHAL